MSEIKVNIYESPVTKPWTNIVKGDVLRFEYGDFDNYVRVVLDHFESDKDDDTIKVVGNYVSNGDLHESYCFKFGGVPNMSVIGHVIE